MQLFKNIDAYPRVWTHLQDPRTDSTLILLPEDVVELDPEVLDKDFDDPWLKPLSDEEAQAYLEAQAAKQAAAEAEAAEATKAAKSKKGAKAPDASEAAAEPDAQKES